MNPHDSKKLTGLLVDILRSNREIRLSFFGGVDPILRKFFPKKIMIEEATKTFAITSHSFEDLIGVVQLSQNKGGKVFISYFLDTKYQGRGIAQQAIYQVIYDYIEKNEPKLIWAKCLRTNTASIQLLERTGFSFQKLIQGSLHSNETLLFKLSMLEKKVFNQSKSYKLVPLAINLHEALSSYYATTQDQLS